MDQPNGYNPHTHYQAELPPNIAQNQNLIYMQNHYATQLQPKMHQQQQHKQPGGPNRIYQQTNANTYATTQPAHFLPDFENHRVSNNSNQSDHIIQERNNQIYSSTNPSTGSMVRSGQYENGKSSFGGKPSILNCPLPAIPSDDKCDKERMHSTMSR